MMRFCHAIEIVECGIQNYVLGFIIRGPKKRRKILPMFYFGEGILSGKHVTQTADRSAQAGEKSTESSNKMAGSSVRISPLSFSFVT